MDINFNDVSLLGRRVRGLVRDETVGVLMIFAAATGFGTLAIFGKLATIVQLDTPTLLVFRFVLATVVLWGFFLVREQVRLLSGRSLSIALVIGVMYGIMTALFFWGLEFLSAGLAAIVFYTYPVHVFIISTILLDETLTRTKLFALSVAVTGVGLIVGVNPTGAHPVGIALVLLAAVAYSIYTTASRVVLSTVGPRTLTANAMIAATLSMILFGIAADGLSVPTGLNQWAIVVGIGLLGTALPIVLFLHGLERIEASRASIIGTSEPLMTVLLGIGLLGEPFTLATVVGGTLVLLGVLLIQREGRPTGMVAH